MKIKRGRTMKIIDHLDKNWSVGRLLERKKLRRSIVCRTSRDGHEGYDRCRMAKRLIFILLYIYLNLVQYFSNSRNGAELSLNTRLLFINFEIV